MCLQKIYFNLEIRLFKRLYCKHINYFNAYPGRYYKCNRFNSITIDNKRF